MSTKRISKATKMRLLYVGIPSLFFIALFAVNLIYNMYTLFTLTQEKKSLERQYIQLQKDAEELKIDIEKLNDPEYKANYARENYLYSKDGEYIIQLESDLSEELDDVSDDINKNYALIFLGLIILFIFVYILTKDKKSKK